MIVCICRGVSDRAIASAVDEGAGSVKAVAKCTRAGTCCGACHDSIREVIERRRSAPAPVRSRLLPLMAAGAT